MLCLDPSRVALSCLGRFAGQNAAESRRTLLLSVGRGASLLLNLPPDRRGRIHENEVKALRQFGRIIGATVAKDLAQDAKVSASNIRGGRSDKRFRPQNVVDGKRDTYRATADEVRTPKLIVALGKEKTLNVVRLREYLPLGQREEAFGLDVWRMGQWVEFATGTSLGNCLLVRGKPTTTSRLRLRITEAPVCAAMSEAGVFVEPE